MQIIAKVAKLISWLGSNHQRRPSGNMLTNPLKPTKWKITRMLISKATNQAIAPRALMIKLRKQKRIFERLDRPHEEDLRPFGWCRLMHQY